MKAVRDYDWRAAVGDALAEVVTLKATGPTTPASGPRRLLSDIEAAAYLNSSRSVRPCARDSWRDQAGGVARH